MEQEETLETKVAEATGLNTIDATLKNLLTQNEYLYDSDSQRDNDMAEPVGLACDG